MQPALDDLDLFGPSFQDDPPAVYEQLRRSGAVHYLPRHGWYLVTRAGNETSGKLITEMLRLLDTKPDEWDRIRADPDRARLVVEEALGDPVAGRVPAHELHGPRLARAAGPGVLPSGVGAYSW